jgi:dTDP-4-dehydrorhamnose reductase
MDASNGTHSSLQHPGTPLQMWGGAECTINRVYDRYFDQLARSGHLDRIEEDIARFARLGLRSLRICLHWERFAAEREAGRDPWRLFDRMMEAVRDHDLAPIVGLVHHGSGPRETSLLDPAFPEKLAGYAQLVAERYPWATAYTPVNEPNTTARFACLYTHWHPHHRSYGSYARALVQQAKGIALSMQAVRRVQPGAQLVTTEDGGRTASTPALSGERRHREDRRWLGTDLLCGTVTANHPLHAWLLANGIGAGELAWFVENPCPPDVLGLNYYLTSDRFLDHRVELYPSYLAGGDLGESPFVDIEALRVCPVGLAGSRAILLDAWRRYGIPVAITECHAGGAAADQTRWLAWIWQGAREARAAGADVRAVTAWALLGSYDWHCLCTRESRTYEPGVFSLQRTNKPRETPLARMVRSLARGRLPRSLSTETPWWLQEGRFTYPPPGRVHAPHIPTEALFAGEPPALLSGTESV